MAVVQHEELLERVGGSHELLVEVIDLFLEDGPQLLSTIQEALVRGDADSVRRGAHALKGSAGNFGASALVAVAHQIELDAAAGSLGSLADRFPALETELSELSAELADLRNRHASGSHQ
jgi:HPt (histidine-containing phosphotransfer) domain-containing protein